MPTGDDDIEIRVILTDEFSRDAERVRQAEDDLADSTRRASEAARDQSDAMDDNAATQRRTERVIRANTQARDENGRFIIDITRTVERETTTIRRNTRERDKSTKSIFRMVTGFFKFGKILNLLKITVIADGIAKAIAGVSALGGIAVGAIGGMAPLVGVLLPLPALLAGAALGMATLKMGFGGLGEAMKAYDPNDMTKFNEAIKEMGPQGQSTAMALGEIAEKMKPIKKLVQETLLDGFASTVTDLGNTYLPILSGALETTAQRLRGTIGIATGFLQLPSTVDEVRDALGSASLIAEQMGHAFNGALRGTLHMFSAVAPVAVEMSEIIAQGINGLADNIFKNEDKIRTFAANGLTMFQQMMGTVVDLFIGFKNIATAGSSLFDGMGGRFGDMADRFKDWTRSVEGQAKIQEYFDKLRPILESLIGLVKDVAGAIGRIAGDNMGSLAPMIDKVREMVPAFESIIGSASGAAPAFLDIANAILQIVGGTDMLTPTAVLLEMATPIIEGLATALTSLPEGLQTAIGWVITFGLVLNTSAMGPVRAYILQLRWVQIALLNLRVGFTLAALAAKGFALSMLSFLFTNPIGWIILAVIALIALFVILWKKSDRFREIVKSIGQWFVDVWNNTLYPLIQKTWQWMQEAWDKVLAVVMPIVTTIVEWVKSKWDGIVSVFNVIVSVVTTVFGIVWTIISTYATLWWTVISTAFNIVKTIVMTVFNVIATIISTAVGIWLGFVMPVLNTFGTIFMGILGIFGKVIGLIVAVWKLGWNIIRLVVNVAILIVKGIIWLIVTWVQFVMGYVIGFFTSAWNTVSMVVRIAIEIIKLVIGWIWEKVMSVLNPIIGFFSMVWMAASAMVSAAINIIMGYISAIWDRVMMVVGPIAAFIGGAFNTAKGYVEGAIIVIKTTVGSIWEKVQDILGSIQRRFESVWGSIRDFVMGIIDRITGALSGITDVVSTISSGIGKAADFVGGIGRAAGGPVLQGAKHLVGEVGPEAFVGANGKVTGIGTHGPEFRKFTQPGFVVPNHVLAGKADASVPGHVMGKLESAMGGGVDTKVRTEARDGTGYLEGRNDGPGGDVWHFEGASFGGNLTMEDVKRMFKEADRNRKERK